MPDFTIEIHGLDALRRKLGVERVNELVSTLTQGVAEDIRDRMARYPGEVSYPISWSSSRQRRAYFAMRTSRGLPVVYTRNSDPMSQRLGPSWVSEKRGIDALVGTRVTYAPWVQSADRQQPMHRATGWITDEQAIAATQRERSGDKIWQRIVEAWSEE